MSDISVTNNTDRSRFEARLGDARAGILSYALGEGTIDLRHTVVEPEFGGRGVGGALAQAALTHAVERDLRVIPTCGYVAAWLERHTEYADRIVSA